MIDQRAIVITHGVLASLAWVIFFPLGSVLLRIMDGPSTWKVHAFVQLFSMAVFTAAAGTGLQMAKRFRLLHNFHVIIGLTIFAVMFIQAVTGYLHHIQFKRHGHRTISSHVHLWLGRALITLGMINGGLGLWMNDRERRDLQTGVFIAYGVVAGTVWSVWVLVGAVWQAHDGDRKRVAVRAQGRLSARARRVQERRARAHTERKNEMMWEIEE